jgi:hypothetical protein
MKKTFYTLLVMAALLLAGSSFATTVNNVELNYQDGNTVAKISLEGTVRFTHQSEEAKDGRPYRVFVDLLKADHNLGAQKFTELPDCPVKAIRTSQYSVQPEKVVRVVFDLDVERVYRVESNENSVTLFFTDKSTKSYASWSSQADVKSRMQKRMSKSEKPVLAKVEKKETVKKSSVDLNKSINEDRMLSLADKNSAAKQKLTKKASNPVAKAAVKKTSTKKVVKKTEKPVFKTVAKTATQKKATTTKKVVAKKVEKKKVVAQVTKSEKPKAEKSKPKTNTVTESTKPVTPKKATVAKKEEKKKSTSRFRRSASRSAKLKGTMVAEFPKRLVIKYKAKNYRDPFETLIDETKTYNQLIERKVPNVEGLKLVGIIESGGTDNRALFEDTEGYGYILKTGDKVKKGYVLRVEDKRVYFQIFEYGWSRTVALTLES